jgi:hypothetical protein
MSARTDVLLWAQRVVARKTAPAHQILEVAAGTNLDVAQDAFHKIARLAHPDLHRTTLSADELELVTTAYSRAAAAYQEFRAQALATSRTRAIRGSGPGPAPVAPTMVIPTSPSPNKAVSVPDRAASQSIAKPGSQPTSRTGTQSMPPLAPLSPAQAMTSKALIYYRKAELCLRRGELTGAVLQLKMAIASDPQSQLLRTALSEVEAEIAKMP